MLILELKQVLSEDGRVHRVVSVVFHDVERADMVHVLRIHASGDEDGEWLEENLVLDLPEVDKGDLDLTDECRVLQLEAHREFEVLRSSFLLDIHLVLVHTLVGCPVDALIRTDWVLSRRRLQNHVLA